MIDIKAGDVVVCVDASPNHYFRRHVLTERAMYRVAEVVVDHAGLGLHLVGLRSVAVGGFKISRFRKVTKADEGFSTWMKSLKPLPAKTRENV